MPQKKYISTKDAIRLTGLSRNEIYDLIHQGKLPAHKAPKSGYRIYPQDLAELGLIQEKPSSRVEVPKIKNCFSYIEDEEHYTQVFKRMTEVKHSLKISTGDLKNFNVYLESDGDNNAIPLYEFFLLLVERGVHVQVMSMEPFYFYLYTKKKCPQLLNHPLFELRYKGHCHMKIFIFDDECAYFGSANITGAAIGRRLSGKRNHEAGVLVSGTMMQAPECHFNKVWNDPDILKHTWKRFNTKAKESEKKLKLKYDK